MSKKPVILVILDGFGASPLEEGNSVLKAAMPNYDSLLAQYPKTLLHASAAEVGLEMGEVGNSEVGHLNLGTGRIIMQDLTRINQAINNKTFFDNQSLKNSCDFVKKNNSVLHLVGLVSNGGIHSHIDHLLALMDLAKQQNIKNLSIHIITDGRDTSPKCAKKFTDMVEAKISKIGIGVISTVCGRFYAMDRDKNWERTKMDYDLIVNGKGDKAANVSSAIQSAYDKGESDENMKAALLDGAKLISDKDAVVFYNFRQDRMTQLVATFIEQNFQGFTRKKTPKIFVSCFVSYGNEPNRMVQIAFFQTDISNQLASIISANNLGQLHGAETEKYAHVTYFFNGGQEKEFKGEKRIIVASPKIDSYDKKPEMSVKEITDKFIADFKKNKFCFGVINLANPDMVGHTGNFKATTKACEAVDVSIGKIAAMAKDLSADLILTADHGNAEQMVNPNDKAIDKNHTTNPVPLILACSDLKLSDQNKFSVEEKMAFFAMEPAGVIADITPTILDILEIKKPREITGQSLKGII